MTITLGRFTTTSSIKSGTLRQDGDVIEFAMDVQWASADEMKARIQQLRGMVDNPDEQVFPFTFSEDSTWDGFYTDVTVSLTEKGVMYVSYHAEVRVRMRRVGGGFAVPQFESITTTVARTNTHSGGASGVYGANYAPTSYDYESTLTGADSFTGEDGTFLVGSAAPGTFDDYLSYVRPADFYKAGAKVEIKYGSTWYPVHGAQIPLATGANWRLNNGYIRLYPSMVAGSNRGFTVETYRSGSWYGQEYQAVSYNSGTATLTPRHATGGAVGYTDPVILRNSPDACTIATQNGASTVFTFTIRRGDLWAEANISFDGGSGTTSYGFGRTVTEAATSFTGGIRATATDANSLRYLLATSTTSHKDTTVGRLTCGSSVASPTFGIFPDYLTLPAGTTAQAFDFYCVARAETRNVVIR